MGTSGPGASGSMPELHRASSVMRATLCLGLCRGTAPSLGCGQELFLSVTTMVTLLISHRQRHTHIFIQICIFNIHLYMYIYRDKYIDIDILYMHVILLQLKTVMTQGFHRGHREQPLTSTLEGRLLTCVMQV